MTKFNELPRPNQIWEKMNHSERADIFALVGGVNSPAATISSHNRALSLIASTIDQHAKVEARPVPDDWI